MSSSQKNKLKDDHIVRSLLAKYLVPAAVKHLLSLSPLGINCPSRPGVLPFKIARNPCELCFQTTSHKCAYLLSGRARGYVLRIHAYV